MSRSVSLNKAANNIANNILHVAMGIIFNLENAEPEVLVALRPEDTPHGGLWEFPGGKFEENETPFAALKRELYEEIGIEVMRAEPFVCVDHDYGNGVCVRLDAWRVEEFKRAPYGREGQRVEWVNSASLATRAFPAGNRLIVEKVLDVLTGHQRGMKSN